MPTCSFCKKHYKTPRGLTVFAFDGRTIHFCSSKCKRNLDLGRVSKKINWVKRKKRDESGATAGIIEEAHEKEKEEELEKEKALKSPKADKKE